jgi:hypothetical protein
MVPNWNFTSFRAFVADGTEGVLADAVDADMLILTVLLCAAAGVGGDEIINVCGGRSRRRRINGGGDYAAGVGGDELMVGAIMFLRLGTTLPSSLPSLRSDSG